MASSILLSTPARCSTVKFQFAQVSVSSVTASGTQTSFEQSASEPQPNPKIFDAEEERKQRIGREEQQLQHRGAGEEETEDAGCGMENLRTPRGRSPLRSLRP